MLRLKTLGGLSVERSHPPPLSSSPRRRLLALLALIAGHDPRGISRDKLLAYLWPESDTTRARSSLKQALSSLRQSLGIQIVQSAGGVLRLDRALTEVDLWEFEAAFARGDEEGAVAAYRGPFLDGFNLGGLEELNRWTKDERERLAHQYADALRILARKPDYPPSREPISSLTLTRASFRVSAPLRRSDCRSAVAAPAVPLPRGWSIPAVPRAVWMVVAVFWAVAFLMNEWNLAAGIGPVHGMEPVEPKRVAVAPFSVPGGRESAELGRGLEELLEARLDELDGLRSNGAGPATSRPGNAQLYVRGQLMVAGESLRARATLYDGAKAHTAVGRAEAAVAGAALFELADALTAQLFAGHDRSPRRIAAETDLR